MSLVGRELTTMIDNSYPKQNIEFDYYQLVNVVLNLFSQALV